MVVPSQVMTAALADPAARIAPPSLEEGSVERRAIAATLVCIARHGLSKTAIDDVAREAGCSRATLYRYFGGRQQLLDATIASEVARIVALVQAEEALADDLEDAVVAVLHIAGDELTRHAALRFVADFEPERLLTHLTFANGDRFLADAAAVIAPSLERFLGERAQRAAEWIARVGLALWLSPTAPVSLGDEREVREYVRAFVLPAIQPQSVMPTSVPVRG